MKHQMMIFIVLFSLAKPAAAQNISGTWGGVFYAPVLHVNHAYHFFVELHQKGRAVWGVYNTTDSNNINIFTCLMSVSGLLPSKPSPVFDLYKEKVEDYDKKNVRYELCSFVNRLSMHYFIQDSVEYITGRWYSEAGGGPTPDGAGGVFVLYHMSNLTVRNPDQYFHKIEKMIEKGKTEETIPIIVGDSMSGASSMEKQLLDVIKQLTGKKTP